MRTNKGKITLLSASICACALCLVTGATLISSGEESSSRTYADLWMKSEGITITDNVAVPDYAQKGWKEIGYESGKMQGKYLTADDLEPWQLNGVKVSTTSESAIVWYSNIVDISGFTKEDSLLDIMPLATTRKINRDFSQMKIYLVDAYDESNWVTVNLRALDLIYYPGTMISVSTSTGFTGAYRWGDFNWNPQKLELETGFGVFYNVCGSSMEGVSDTEILFEAFSIRYDVNANSVWFNSSCIMDLQDTPNVGEGKEFNGFTGNRIRIGIQAMGIESAPAEYMLLNVAGHGMNGPKIQDTEKPYYDDYYAGEELPVAMVGKPYKLLDSFFYDFYDGELVYTVDYKKSTQESYTAVTGDAFTPQEAGEYLLRYKGKDKAGNETVLEYSIQAKNRVDIQALHLELNDTPIEEKIGKKIYLPNAETSGGSGKPCIETKVIRLSDNVVMDVKDGYFVPMFSGDYAIVYTATDYVGEVVSKRIQCTVKNECAPILEQEMVMYSKLVDKIQMPLPKPIAYDYVSLMGHRIAPVVEITAKGTGDKAAYSQKIENYAFTPDINLFGKQVVLEYKLYCSGYPEAAITRSYTVDIIQPEYVWEYLTYDDTMDLSYNQKGDETKFVAFTANQDTDVAELQLIQPIRAEGFEIMFGVDADKDRFDCVEIELCDWLDTTKKITLQVKKYTNVKSEVYYNGKLSYMSGGFGAESGLQLKYQDEAIVDYLGTKVFDLSDFDGFESGKVWVKVRMLSASKSAQLKILKLGIQSFGADYRSSGMTAFRDTIAPEIELLFDMPSSVDFNTTVVLPYANTYDWCSGYCDLFVSVTGPDGTVLIDSQPLDKDMSFKAMQYGMYKVAYYAYDDAERRTTLLASIFVEDKVKPVIIYSGDASMEKTIAEEVVFEQAVVYDNLDTNLELYVYVIQSNGLFINISDTLTYTFETTGKYIVRYCVYDANYNYSWIDITVWVK